jgi:hypothetical protein
VSDRSRLYDIGWFLPQAGGLLQQLIGNLADRIKSNPTSSETTLIVAETE